MLSASVLGQKPGQKLAIGYAIDDATNLGVGITDSLLTFKLLYPDSSVVDTRAIVNFKDWTLNGIRTTKFYVVLPKEGKYILYLAHPEYETVYRPINVKFHPKILNPELDTVRMRRIMKTDMKEVTVKATKLKFYFRKDTIVYNADVFMTQDGFMLDDILKKMPGLTFKNGEIFSNGRKIDALLLNGKDFFNKDRRTLLNNLPAYMVKNVVVYDKSKDPQSKYERERNFEGLVMDIKLKREYNQSTLGNMGIGVGTDRRHMGRAFGMKMHDLYRISAFAGSNNVGSNEQGGYNDFVSNTAGSDEKKNHFGGINYNVDEKDGKFSANGNLRIQGDKEQTINQESKELFFKEGMCSTIHQKTTGRVISPFTPGTTLRCYRTHPGRLPLRRHSHTPNQSCARRIIRFPQTGIFRNCWVHTGKTAFSRHIPVLHYKDTAQAGCRPIH